MVRVPDWAWEDLRQLHREREDLLAERTRHRNRLSSKLVAPGVWLPIGREWELYKGRKRSFEPLSGKSWP